ncbi:MAG: 4Fe-4S binding protein [Clostridia bacterium]
MMVDKKKCIGCGACIEICPVGAISFSDDGTALINEKKCVKCGSCSVTCPVSAITIRK